MASALKPSGGTWAWQQLRKAKAQELADAGGLVCWRCGRMVYPTDAWHLGHLVDRALGGNDDHLAVEHARCSSSAGAKLGNRLRGQRRQARTRQRMGMMPDMINDQLINDLNQARQDLITNLQDWARP